MVKLKSSWVFVVPADLAPILKLDLVYNFPSPIRSLKIPFSLLQELYFLT